ncbi:MAG: caspase family protein [Cyclobacteriaceae bacterium]|nr:caspase family protein [Cyclobacteriaceae bacterium]
MVRILCIAACWWMASAPLLAQAPRIVINPMGHSAKVHNLVFTPDGSRIISISEDKTIRVWNAENGDMLKKFESQIGDGWEGMLYASALSPDGKLLAVSGYPVSTEKENYIIIIDVEKGVQVATAIGHTNVINTLSFSGSGLYLASGSDDRTIKIWKVENTPTLKTVATISTNSAVTSLSFNARTQDLAVAVESRDILVYALQNLDKGATKFTPKPLKKHRGILNKVVYSPEGSYLASCSFDNELILWNADGTVVKEFGNIKEPVNALAFSFDGKILAALDVTGKGASYAVPGGARFTDFLAHDNTVFCAAFSPSLTGNYVVASAGGSNNEIYLWNPINGLIVRKIKGKGSAIYNLAFGEDLELFISREFSKSGKPQYKNSFNFSSFTINRNPSQQPAKRNLPKDAMQTGINTISLPKGKTIATSEGEDGRILDYLALDDGSVVVASDFSLKMFDKNGYLNKEFIGHSGAVRAVTVSADGQYLASGGEDQSIIIWKLSESGFAPSMRSFFDTPEWASYFNSLPIDSLTKEPTKKAWQDVIAFMKANGQKAVKEVEAIYKSLGEVLIPFATLFLTEDNEWVCWTPRGYFSCSSAGGQYFGWHVNRGIEQLADFFSAEQYFEVLYRPKEMSKSISEGKRVEDILRESGERIFDLGKLHRPSVGFFDVSVTMKQTDLLRYNKGTFITQARTVPLTVEIFDGGGGVKEVNIYQNDKLIINDTDVKTNGEGEKVEKTYAVEMVNELNEFKVKVVNYQKIESRADVLPVEYTGEVIATSSLYVLSVGINEYQNASYNLNYARPDAQSFTEKILEHGKGIFKSVNRLEIYDKDATRENILKGFKSIVSRAKPEDVFVFYYAGHGTLDEDNNNEYYLVPTDITKLYGDHAQLTAKGISATELKDQLTQLKAQKQIVLMDACHSGGAIKSMNVRAAASDERAIVQLARSSGVVMMASSGTQQFATEFEELRHGVFTYALLEALEGKADNGDGKITVNEIKMYMEERVPELTKKHGGKAQYPTGYITGNDFPISIIKK